MFKSVLSPKRIAQYNAILSFRVRDNSVHSLECSPFWVDILVSFKQRNLPCLLLYVEMHILIANALQHLYLKV